MLTLKEYVLLYWKGLFYISRLLKLGSTDVMSTCSQKENCYIAVIRHEQKRTMLLKAKYICNKEGRTEYLTAL